MPKYGADGDVIDVSLTTVKVQNWDKTITTIPAHALVDDAFKNWRGMSESGESGGRRIKRSICLDISSVRFLKKSEVEDLEKIECLQPYLNSKKSEIGEKGMNLEELGVVSPLLNGRNLTNVGTFPSGHILRFIRSDILRAHQRKRSPPGWEGVCIPSGVPPSFSTAQRKWFRKNRETSQLIRLFRLGLSRSVRINRYL